MLLCFIHSITVHFHLKFQLESWDTNHMSLKQTLLSQLVVGLALIKQNRLCLICQESFDIPFSCQMNWPDGILKSFPVDKKLFLMFFFMILTTSVLIARVLISVLIYQKIYCGIRYSKMILYCWWSYRPIYLYLK